MLEKLLGVINFEHSGSILSLVVRLFGRLFTWIGVCLAFSKHSFRYHASMFPFTCESKGRHLFISSSYYACISFIFNPLLYNTMYLFWFATFYGFPSFMALSDHTIDNLGTHLLWCPCKSECTTTHNTLWILSQLLFWRMEHMFRGRFPTFSLVTPDNKWKSFEPWWTSSLLTRFT